MQEKKLLLLIGAIKVKLERTRFLKVISRQNWTKLIFDILFTNLILPERVINLKLKIHIRAKLC